MAESKINYTVRNYDEYRQSIIDISKKYYPDVFDNFNDASIGSWLIDVMSDICDSLNYHIDRVYQETSVTSAGERSSLLEMARTLGVNIPGKKAAIVEVELSCVLPQANATGNERLADERYAPCVKRGTLFSTGLVTFELDEDVDFKEQFNSNGVSDRQVTANRDSNGNITGYTYKKLAIAVAGQSRIYKKTVTVDDLKPFMTVVLKDGNILGVESVIVKRGTHLNDDPNLYEFFVDREDYKTYSVSDTSINEIDTERFFEVDNLVQQYRYGYEVKEVETIDNAGHKWVMYNPVWEGIDGTFTVVTDENDEDDNPIKCTGTATVRQCVNGCWKRLKNKFITEYTDNGSLKVIFGAGIRNKYGVIPGNAGDFTRYMMSRMEANDYMGVLPEPNSTMYILYRVGGGEMSNIAANSLNSVIFLNMTIDGNCEDLEDDTKKRNVRTSLTVTNTSPSYGGKDEPTEEEIRYLIKYHVASQNRCVTLHDYQAKVLDMPFKYGTPFRVSAIEENNKVVIYALGLDPEGHLSTPLSEVVANNMKSWLSNYRMINDFVEIRSGRVINVAFEIDVFVDKTYDKNDVVKRIIDLTYSYMDIRNRQMGDDIFLGDLEKEISKLDGVKNLIGLKCYNRVGNEGDTAYSSDAITQSLVDPEECGYDDYAEGGENFNNQIDLNESDKMLFSEADSMFEVKYKGNDIIVNVKTK